MMPSWTVAFFEGALPGQGKTRQHARAALRCRSYIAASAQLLGPLAHGGEADPGATAFRYPHAVVCDLHLQHASGPINRETDATRPGTGVSRDVRQGFLGDAVAGHLHGGRQEQGGFGSFQREKHQFIFSGRPVRRVFALDDEAVALRLLVDGRNEPKVVECGGLRP
jgi:hypothetical protein